MLKKILLILGLALVLVGCKSDDPDTRAQLRSATISNEKKDIAQLMSENYPLYSQQLLMTLNKDNLSVNILSLLNDQAENETKSRVKQADSQIRHLQGIEEFSDNILELRLVNQAMLTALKNGQSPLFAFEPKGSEKEWQYIEAFDVNGVIHQLDVHQAPTFPVLVIDSNNAQTLIAGLKAMRAEFERLGHSSVTLSRNPDQLMRSISDKSGAQPISTTVLKSIYLDDNMEPWILGKSEIYALITGVDPSRDAPIIDVIDMPYLHYEKVTYRPNQVLVHWSRYRWGAADIVIMEQDSNTDYKELAKLLVEAAEKVLQSIPSLETQGYAVIANLTNRIIDAIPSSWFSNDDDFVDVYYTIQQDKHYIDHPGATNNALVTLEPLTIYPTR
ncbi:DUF3103 family protein [Vibrio metschnikovii]|uniref:DUF3103 family protein n=1 Tax=Vibrio metschnikovii TaxID=28172 RepID=UPI001C30C0DB|nr:DUF3103 family protein [Vibrio metschnikovii]